MASKKEKGEPFHPRRTRDYVSEHDSFTLVLVKGCLLDESIEINEKKTVDSSE